MPLQLPYFCPLRISVTHFASPVVPLNPTVCGVFPFLAYSISSPPFPPCTLLPFPFSFPVKEWWSGPFGRVEIDAYVNESFHCVAFWSLSVTSDQITLLYSVRSQVI